jgi:hypothetical protein
MSEKDTIRPPGGQLNLANLAGSDMLNPWNLIMANISIFLCRTGTGGYALPVINGAVGTIGGTNNSQVTCPMLPKFDDQVMASTVIPIVIPVGDVIGGAATSYKYMWEAGYDDVNHRITIEWFQAGALFADARVALADINLDFYVIFIGRRRGRNRTFDAAPEAGGDGKARHNKASIGGD